MVTHMSQYGSLNVEQAHQVLWVRELVFSRHFVEVTVTNFNWGNHVMSLDKDQAIIHNRNAFVAQFGIRSYVDGDRRPAYVRAKIDRNNNRHMDHCEVYKDEQGDWVLLTSPCLPEEGIRHLEANGWQTSPPLYAAGATTMVMVVPACRRNGN